MKHLIIFVNIKIGWRKAVLTLKSFDPILDLSATNLDETFDYFCKYKDWLEEGSFNLKKFRSNSAELE